MPNRRLSVRKIKEVLRLMVPINLMGILFPLCCVYWKMGYELYQQHQPPSIGITAPVV